MSNSRSSITALVPIKARWQCKTRLQGILSDSDRQELVRGMLNHVLNVLQQVPGVQRIVVMTPERDEIAAHIETLPDEGLDLNDSLKQALQRLHAQGDKRVLILPADLACLQVADIQALSTAARDAEVVIAPSADNRGTNALLLPSNAPIGLRFGTNSFRAHCQQVQLCGLSSRMVRRFGLGLDVDNYADLLRWRERVADQQLFRAGVSL